MPPVLAIMMRAVSTLPIGCLMSQQLCSPFVEAYADILQTGRDAQTGNMRGCFTSHCVYSALTNRQSQRRVHTGMLREYNTSSRNLVLSCDRGGKCSSAFVRSLILSCLKMLILAVDLDDSLLYYLGHQSGVLCSLKLLKLMVAVASTCADTSTRRKLLLETIELRSSERANRLACLRWRFECFSWFRPCWCMFQ